MKKELVGLFFLHFCLEHFFFSLKISVGKVGVKKAKESERKGPFQAEKRVIEESLDGRTYTTFFIEPVRIRLRLASSSSIAQGPVFLSPSPSLSFPPLKKVPKVLEEDYL